MQAHDVARAPQAGIERESVPGVAIVARQVPVAAAILRLDRVAVGVVVRAQPDGDDFGIGVEDPQRRLDEPGLEELPVVLAMEQVWRADLRVGDVDAPHLPEVPPVVEGPRREWDQVHLVLVVIDRARILDEDAFLDRVGVEGQERFDGRLQQVRPAAGRDDSGDVSDHAMAFGAQGKVRQM
jgi:hypothetical protein